MQFSRPAVFVFLVVACQILPSCNSPAANANNANIANVNSPANSQTGPKDNIEEFGMLVRIPFEPEEVVWEEKPGQNALTAIIRFSSENASKMSAEVAKGGAPKPEILTVEKWYPAELIAQSELSGESTVSGKSYPAGPFLNPPYTKGTITRIDNTDYFILQISS